MSKGLEQQKIVDNSKETQSNSQNNIFFGLLFGILVLIGNGIHPIINNTRPNSLQPLNFLLQMSIFEFISAIPTFFIEIYQLKKQNRTIRIPKDPKDKSIYFLRLFIIGFVFTIANYFYIIGLELAGSVSGAIALKISPLYLLIIGVLFLNERFDWKQLGIVILMLAGLFYLATEGTWQIEIFSIGFGILLLTPLLWSIGHAITKVLLRKNQTFPSMVIMVRTGIITILIFWFILFTEGWDYIAISYRNIDYQKFSFYMGFVYFLMHFGWYSSIRYLDLSFASALVTPSPILTMLFAIWFTDEVLFNFQIIGMIWVILGLYLLLLNKQRSNKKRNETSHFLEKSKPIN